MNLANQRVLALTSVLDTKVSLGLAKATLLGSPLGDDHTVGPGFVYTLLSLPFLPPLTQKKLQNVSTLEKKNIGLKGETTKPPGKSLQEFL